MMYNVGKNIVILQIYKLRSEILLRTFDILHFIFHADNICKEV